jgi:hypothetical protein
VVVLWHVVYVAKIVITIFRDPKDDQLVVEFQRRRGDRYVFHRFFREVLQKSSEVFGAQVRIPRGPMSTPMDLPMDDDESIGEEGLKPLVEMIFSPYNDVAVDGARALVAAAQNEKSLLYIATHAETGAVLKHLLSSTDAERACCGVHLLADITKRSPSDEMADHVASALQFFNEDAIEWHETHRQLARALHNYSGCAQRLRSSCNREMPSLMSLGNGSRLKHFRGAQREQLSELYAVVSGHK